MFPLHVARLVGGKVYGSGDQRPHVELKSPREIDLLRRAGQVSAKILMALKNADRGGDDDGRCRQARCEDDA